jgi:hypothetical protein
MKEIVKFPKLCCKHSLEGQMKNENILINKTTITEIVQIRILGFYFVNIVLLIVVLLIIADPFNVKVLLNQL